MNLHQIKELLKNSLEKHLTTAISSLELLPVGGGSINDTYKVIINGSKKFFLKLNSLVAFPGLFEKEKNGLEFLARQNCIRIPSIIFYETNDNCQLLLLEWIESGILNEHFWKKFGEQLAKLHTISNEHFGFPEDNYMGSLPQENTFTKDWVEFFISYRLRPQIELARNKQLIDKNHIASFERLSKKLDSVLDAEKPSLLHGDLWSGNFMCTDQSLPF